MNTHRIGTGARRWWLLSALLAASCVTTLPALAAPGCNPNGYQVSPKNQNNVLEFDAANNFNRNLVHLGISKGLDVGAVPTWSQVSGPAVTLDTSDPLSPSFLTPDVPAAGATLTFRLTVTCPDGSNAANDGTVSVINVNRPPVAYASSAPPIAYYGDAVVLHSYAPAGSPVTIDPDGDSLVYSWTRTAGPVVTLANADSATASFTAPAAGSPYTLQFLLTVRDRPTGGLTSTVNVVVNVSQYLPPLARLVCPEHVNELGQVVLNGSTSSDPNGGVLTYQWTQLQGSPAIAIGGETGSTVTFNAPKLTTGQDGLLEFQLKATDTRGLFDLATCMTQIDDVTAPVLSLPANINAEATSGAGAMVDYDAAAQDAVDDAAPYVPECVPPPGTTFPLAAAPVAFKTTAVTCTATDTSGNTASAGFSVTVRDSTPPSITVPGSLGVEATSASGAPATFSAPTSDAVDGAGTANCTPASGATFPLGTTVVSCNASDARGNAAAPAGFSLTVHDTTAPVVTPPANTTIEATATLTPLTAADYGNATATDAVGVVSITSNAPAAFPLGVTTITWTAKDAIGNTGTATSTVTVQDVTSPVVTPPADTTFQAVAALTPLTTADYGTATATDAVGVVSLTNDAPASFPVGTTTVTWTATDAAGNAGTATSTVTVQDTIAPAVTPPANSIFEATAPLTLLTAADYGDATATDAVGVVSLTNDAPLLFPVGITTITWTATDAAGNAGTAVSTVTVQDTIAPVVTAPASTTFEATAPLTPLTAANYGDATATDAVGVISLTNDAPASFAVGTTTVTWTATDAAGNAGTATSTVTVRDTTAPVVTAPANATFEATALLTPLTAADYGNASALDAVGVASLTSDAPASFPLGTTTITWAATDAAGNVGTATSTITVRDTTAPVVTAPANSTFEAIAPLTPLTTADYGNATASDAVGVDSLGNDAPASFPLGVTSILWTAVDAAGNTGTATSTVTVRDRTPPTIAAHGNLVAEATGPGGASVGYVSPATSDLVDGPGIASCLPASGHTFSLGVHTVTCNAVDGAGNGATPTTFSVTVRDTTRPVIGSHDDEVREATGPDGAVVSYTAPATIDVVDVGLVATCLPASGATFALGAHTVTCNATDGSGNAATPTTFTVTVRDTTAPAITAHADVNVTAAANSSALVTYTDPTAQDLVDGTRPVSCVLASGNSFPVGATTVTCSASDIRGNTATRTFKVNVSYNFNGFLQPVDNTIVNTVKAGSAIPVKFGLGGNQGLGIFASNSPASVATAQCDGSATDEVEITVTAGNSNLSYDAGANQYIYVWKTEKNWIGCRQLRMTFKDGSVRTAMFKFR